METVMTVTQWLAVGSGIVFLFFLCVAFVNMIMATKYGYGTKWLDIWGYTPTRRDFSIAFYIHLSCDAAFILSVIINSYGT